MTIKRISVHDLKIGMHIHEFCGEWIDHPFWRSKFTVSTDDEVQRVIAGGHSDVWIDSDKGLDKPPVEARLTPASHATSETDPASSTAVEIESIEAGDIALSKALALFRRSVPKIAAVFEEARLGRKLDAAGCEALVSDISDSVVANPGALISLARIKRRDEYTYMHSIAVCALMVGLANKLGMPPEQMRTAGLAGMLHDLGKVAIPLDILNKPGKLTVDEFALMMTHPVAGHAMLVDGGTAPGEVLDVCLHHHEKVDGSGYPHGLTGDKLGLLAKMGAVCDVYDALTSERPYKNGWDPAEAVRSMAQWKGHFDPQVYQAFVRTVGIYPVGSLVRLNSGRLAVVMAQSAGSLLKPRVKAFFSTKSDMRIEPLVVELFSPWCQDTILASEPLAAWSFKDLDQLWGAPQAWESKR